MKYAIVDERIPPACARGLLLFGFAPIMLSAAKGLGKAVKSHPDILMFAHGKNIITSAQYCEDAPHVFSDIREYTDASIAFTADIFREEYPLDAIFNALVIGEKIFMKTDTVSRSVIDYAERTRMKIVHTNQGYPACTVLAFGNSAITADRGMAKILAAEGIKVTLISEGDISLPPHKHGFIGGAAGVYEEKVFFLGDINLHKDADLIRAAITEEGFAPVSLSWEPLGDFGRILFI